MNTMTERLLSGLPADTLAAIRDNVESLREDKASPMRPVPHLWDDPPKPPPPPKRVRTVTPVSDEARKSAQNARQRACRARRRGEVT